MRKDLDVNLAISLHAVNDKLRDELVPINKKYNISTLIQALKNTQVYQILEELLGNM